MTIGYTRDQFEEKFTELEKLDKHTDEHFCKYMKLMISFGRATIITEKGIKKGKELYKKWKSGKELTREENMACGFLVSDISVLEDNHEMMTALHEIYNDMVVKHKPDFGYLQSFGRDHMVEVGYTEPNPKYMETMEQMFIADHVANDPEQINMINSGEMPIYDKVKACPYCGKSFREVELLFKHVKSEHDKK